MLKIVLTGPESSGKTELAEALASLYRVPLVREYARAYLESGDGTYREEDLLQMAQHQLDWEDEAMQQGGPFFICDTSLEVYQIWSEVRYGRVHPWIRKHTQQYPADFYLLCRPDLPWVSDPLRENPDDRDMLFEKYLALLRKGRKDFQIVEGQGHARERRAVSLIDQWLVESLQG